MRRLALVDNALCLSETDYGKPEGSQLPLSISLCAQQGLDTTQFVPTPSFHFTDADGVKAFLPQATP